MVASIGSSSVSTIAPESSPDTRRCHQLLPPSTATTANGGYPALTNWARPASTPMPMTPDAVMSRPCSAITGRSGPNCPGGMAIAHSVSTPPRAAETNEPVRYVGDALADERRRLVGRRGSRRGGEPQLPHRIERTRTGDSGAQPQDRAARQLLASACQLKASQLGSARSRESQSTCWVSQLPLGDPAPLHMPPVSRRNTIADEPPPSSSTALSAPSPRNRS